MTTTWEPRTYLRFRDVRFRAGLDLVAHIPKNNYRTIYDLGCGTGYLTHALSETFPEAAVTGVDSSPEMLAEARRDFPQISWVHADINDWRPPAAPDLIFSNAALHWLPNHKALFLSLLQMLAPGGALAVQMPRHHDTPSHIELKKLVLRRQWRAKLEPLLLKPLSSPETYWRWLSPHAANLDVWETVYLLVLDGAEPVLEFMRGSALRPFLTVLSKADGSKLVSEFARHMAAAYPHEASGKTLYPFRRLFLIAQR